MYDFTEQNQFGIKGPMRHIYRDLVEWNGIENTHVYFYTVG